MFEQRSALKLPHQDPHPSIYLPLPFWVSVGLIASAPIVLVRVTTKLDANLSLLPETPLPDASFCPPSIKKTFVTDSSCACCRRPRCSHLIKYQEPLRWCHGEKRAGMRGDREGKNGRPCAIYNLHLHNGINRTSVCIQRWWGSWKGEGGSWQGEYRSRQCRQVQEYTCLTG